MHVVSWFDFHKHQRNIGQSSPLKNNKNSKLILTGRRHRITFHCHFIGPTSRWARDSRDRITYALFIFLLMRRSMANSEPAIDEELQKQIERIQLEYQSVLESYESMAPKDINKRKVNENGTDNVDENELDGKKRLKLHGIGCFLIELIALCRNRNCVWGHWHLELCFGYHWRKNGSNSSSAFGIVDIEPGDSSIYPRREWKNQKEFIKRSNRRNRRCEKRRKQCKLRTMRCNIS